MSRRIMVLAIAGVVLFEYLIFFKDREPLTMKTFFARKFQLLAILVLASLMFAAHPLQAAVDLRLSPDIKSIDTDGAPTLGNPNARHKLVVYACYTCPHCKKHLPELMSAVQSGKLGSYQLIWKLWPLRTVEGSKPMALAILAANKQNKAWAYFSALLKNPNNYEDDYIVATAKQVGIKMDQFDADRKSFALKQAMITSKIEGAKNGVKETPTYFIDGHEYIGSKKIDDVMAFLKSY